MLAALALPGCCGRQAGTGAEPVAGAETVALIGLAD